MSKLSLTEITILLDQLRAMQSMSGGNGSKVYGIAAHTGLSLSAISVREDSTVFESLGATGSGHPLALTDFYLNGTTPKAGDLLTPPPGYRFTSFELSAGSVQGN
jgi:hypothetical protein